MTRKSTLILMVSIPAFWGCGDSSMEPEQMEPEQKIQILMNGDVENGASSPSNWSFSSPMTLVDNAYDFAWSTEYSVSPLHSLKISLDAIVDEEEFAVWQQRIVVDSALVGKELTLMGSIKLENVIGQGAAIAIRSDDSRLDGITGAEAIATTQGSVSLVGTSDWSIYEVRLRLPEGIDVVTVFFLLLTNTTGAVYFDDFSLSAPVQLFRQRRR